MNVIPRRLVRFWLLLTKTYLYIFYASYLLIILLVMLKNLTFKLLLLILLTYFIALCMLFIIYLSVFLVPVLIGILLFNHVILIKLFNSAHYFRVVGGGLFKSNWGPVLWFYIVLLKAWTFVIFAFYKFSINHYRYFA